MLEEIRQLYDYDRWANRRTLDAVATAGADDFARDLGNSFPSVRDTLVHILGAEWIWLERWRGTSPTGFSDAASLDTLPHLRERWERHEDDLAAFLSGLTEEGLLADVEYRNTKGEPFAQPLWQLMRHVVNHSTYHRGQVTTMLRQLGAVPATTDLVAYYREGA